MNVCLVIRPETTLLLRILNAWVYFVPALSVVGLLLHAAHRSKVARWVDVAAITAALLVPAFRFGFLPVLVEFGFLAADQREVRRLIGATLTVFLLTSPWLLLSTAALLVSSSKRLSEPLK